MKNKFYKTLNYSSGGTLNFDFLEKCLGIVSSPPFMYNFSRKIFIILYSVKVGLSLSKKTVFLASMKAL